MEIPNSVILTARVGNSYVFSHTGCFLLRNVKKKKIVGSQRQKVTNYHSCKSPRVVPFALLILHHDSCTLLFYLCPLCTNIC